MEEKIIEIYKNESSKLLNFIESRINPLEEAEDILQDVFLKALMNINTLQSIDNLIGWLYKVAKNKITDRYRKKNRNNIALDEIEKDNSLKKLLIDPKSDINKIIINDEMIEIIIEAIDELPDDQRFIIVEHEIEKRSFKEVSADIGVSINTLLSRKRYAVSFLRRKLSKYYTNIQ